MALRARLVAPPPKPRELWPYHTLKTGTVPASLLFAGDRRMEAGTYLSSGFAIRAAIEARSTGWVRLGTLAEFWSPPRIKQIEVDREHGVPYLNTSQVFGTFPTTRKFLAVKKTTSAGRRLVEPGTILMMASATPGRCTLATNAHRDAFVSHHFMRVIPRDDKHAGWVYAFLRSSYGRALTSGAQYASIIRHIEPHHAEGLPIPEIPDALSAQFNQVVAEILTYRNRSLTLTEQAEAMFSEALGNLNPSSEEAAFVVRAHALTAGRRRLEASFHNPVAAAVFKRFKRWERLRSVTKKVWWMTRFARNYGEHGIAYLSADELFTVNPEQTRRILVDPDDNYREFFVEPGWIVMACSGQVYGLNGAAALMTEHHRNTFFSHDLIRIVADTSKIRAGYLLVTLTHRTHGRPLLIRAAYGTSIPHLDPADVADFPVVRLDQSVENQIADLAESAARCRGDADALERRLADDAAKVVQRFIAGE